MATHVQAPIPRRDATASILHDLKFKLTTMSEKQAGGCNCNQQLPMSGTTTGNLQGQKKARNTMILVLWCGHGQPSQQDVTLSG